MKLKDQVASLELAKRLKELGVKQESFFRWVMWAGPGPQVWCEVDAILGQGYADAVAIYKKGISAFTVAELMEALPAGFFLRKSDLGWTVSGLGVPWQENEEPITRRTESIADAPAKMLIHLIKKGLVTVEDVNKRLREAV